MANPPPPTFCPQRPHSGNESYPQIQITHHISLLKLGLTEQTKKHTTTWLQFAKLIYQQMSFEIFFYRAFYVIGCVVCKKMKARAKHR